MLGILVLGILAAFAECERWRIKERQAEGIALATARGKYVQVPKLSGADVGRAQAMISMGVPKTEVARTFGISRQTLYTSLRRVAPQRLPHTSSITIPVVSTRGRHGELRTRCLVRP